MKLIEFPQQTTVIAKDQPEYEPMPAFVHNEQTICLWQLTWKERIQILLRGQIWHRILNFRQPIQPQLLEVDSPFVRRSAEKPA